jgi:hypothetical protein
MPIIPSQTGFGGRIQSPGENRGFLIDVIDHTAGTVYDVILDFIFGFENVPENWTRKMRVFAKFDRNMNNEIDPESKDLKRLYRILQQMGFTRIEGGKLSGIGVNEKGKFVDENDRPIKDIAGLLKTLGRDKSYLVYIAKDSNGYDRVIGVIDEELNKSNDAFAVMMQENYAYWIERSLKAEASDTHTEKGGKSESSNDDLIYVPRGD